MVLMSLNKKCPVGEVQLPLMFEIRKLKVVDGIESCKLVSAY